MSGKCYSCKFRGEVPGSAHSKCEADDLIDKIEKRNPMIGLAAAMGGGKLPPAKSDKVKFDPQGIRGGWAGWPFNFDPVWLEKCDYYEAKGEKVES